MNRAAILLLLPLLLVSLQIASLEFARGEGASSTTQKLPASEIPKKEKGPEGTMNAGPSYESREKFVEMNSLKSEDKYEPPQFKLQNIEVNTDGIIRSEKIDKNAPVAKVQIIMDSSGSMGQLLNSNNTKMYYAKKLLSRYLIDQWKEKAKIGLRVYGSKKKNDCEDNYLALSHSKNHIGEVEYAVGSLLPVGRTPLNDSIKKAVKGLKGYDGPKRIVVFTDGEETCGGDPCALSKEMAKDPELDVRIFVVAIGFSKGSERYKAVQCIGKTHLGNSEEDLFNAMGAVSNSINKNNNLEVKSPDPLAPVVLYRTVKGKRKVYRSFTAAWGVRVPPGRYEAVVGLKPAYRFKPFTIPPGKKVVLEVEGQGNVIVNFFGGLLDVELLDKNRQVVHKFKSDQWAKANMGMYTLRVYRLPYFEKMEHKFKVFPSGKHEYEVGNAGAVRVKYPKITGLYVYDSGNRPVGNYLTNFPLVLKNGNYRLHVDKNCNFDNINLGGGKQIVELDCSSGRSSGKPLNKKESTNKGAL